MCLRVLVDGAGMQARVHRQDGVRLRDVINVIEEVGARVRVTSTNDELTLDMLRRSEVVIIPTRSPMSSDGYTSRELDALEAFVGGGGGLLLMSNHGATERLPDHTAHDRRVAARFGVTLEASVFCGGPPESVIAAVLGTKPEDVALALSARRTLGDLARERGVDLDEVLDALTVVIESQWLADHPVTRGILSGVCFNNAASLRASKGVSLVGLPPDLIDIGSGLSPEGRAFAVALDGAADEIDGDGRVIVVGDSGFIGSRGSSFPGPGLIHRADNTTFVTNAVSWLGAPAN
jgi:hypothetical protein